MFQCLEELKAGEIVSLLEIATECNFLKCLVHKWFVLRDGGRTELDDEDQGGALYPAGQILVLPLNGYEVPAFLSTKQRK